MAEGRSRKGAWIEIVDTLIALITPSCRSRKGAWIEMLRARLKLM